MERKQPVVTGVDAKGELVWGWIPMPRWQCLMFPIKYAGDFMAFWMRRAFFDKTGIESDAPSLSFEIRKFGKERKERRNTGD